MSRFVDETHQKPGEGKRDLTESCVHINDRCVQLSLLYYRRGSDRLRWEMKKARKRELEAVQRMARLLAKFSADSAPVPLVMMVAAGAKHVQHDAAETGLSELSLHQGLLELKCSGFMIFIVTEDSLP